MPCRMIYECSVCSYPCMHIICRETALKTIPDTVFVSDLETLNGICCLHGKGKWNLSYSENYDD